MFWLTFTIIAARTLIEIIFFSIGAAVFSFMNVIIYRLPRHKGFTFGKSECTTCHHELTYKDMVPIFSWLALKGKCRYCGSPISPRYMLVEAIGGISAVCCTLFIGINLRALLAFIVSAIVTVIVFIAYDKIVANVTSKND